MKKFICFLALMLVGSVFVFAETTDLFNSNSSAKLDEYEYVTNFEVDSDSGNFVKGENLAIKATSDGIEAVAWNVPKYNSSSYKILPAYPSELNEANSGSGYIKNAAAIKSVKIVATLNRPYDDLFLLYSTTPTGETKRIKMPHYDSAKSMIEQEYVFDNASYIDNVNNRNVKNYPLVGSYKQAIYFRGIQVQTNAAYGFYGYGDYSTVKIKSVAVTYDKAETDESVTASEEFETKYGIDPTKNLREKTKAVTQQKVTARNNAKELMDSSSDTDAK